MMLVKIFVHITDFMHHLEQFLICLRPKSSSRRCPLKRLRPTKISRYCIYYPQLLMRVGPIKLSG